MNLLELSRRRMPGHSNVLLGRLQITLRGFSNALSGVVFKKIKREAKKSG